MKIKKILLYSFFGIFLVILTSCSIQATDEDIKKNIQSSFDSNFPGEDIRVLSFITTPIGGNNYSGILRTNENGELFEYHVDVLINGLMFEWEIIDDGQSPATDMPVSPGGLQNTSKEKEESHDLKSYLRKNTFTINGNGNVSFNFNSMSNQGQIQISGNGNTLLGKCSLMESGFYIDDLVVVSGNFDASNNNGSFGNFIINPDGSFNGVLMDRNGNSRNYRFVPK